MFLDAQMWIAALVSLVMLIVLVCILVFMLIRAAFAFKDVQMRDLMHQKESYENMALQAITYLEIMANRERREQGTGPLPVVPPVVPEHNSPITELQQTAADMATLRARLVVVASVLNLPQRTASDDQ